MAKAEKNLKLRGTFIPGRFQVKLFDVVVKQYGANEYKHRTVVHVKKGICCCHRPECKEFWWLDQKEKNKLQSSIPDSVQAKVGSAMFLNIEGFLNASAECWSVCERKCVGVNGSRGENFRGVNQNILV